MTISKALHPPTLSTPDSASPVPRPCGARAALALVCAFCAWLALSAAPAAAKVIHNQEGSFNGSDRPTIGSFSGFLPSDAVNESNGDVWVTESMILGGAFGKADVVDKFNGKGEYAGVQITGSETPQKEFNFGSLLSRAGIAVDNTASGPHKSDLYVADIEHGVVDRFSSSGAFECQITGKTPASAEEITHECNGAAGSEPTSGPGIEPAGLAVDSAGDLYVADRAHSVIDVFGPSGEYKRRITDPHLESPATIALDSAGNLYVTNFDSNVVEFDSSGAFVKVLTEGESIVGVGVDPANNHVYVGTERENPATGKEGVIAEYEPSGTLLDVFGSGHFVYLQVSFAGLAVGPTGKLYAAEAWGNGEVHIYSPDIVLPDVTTQGATEAQDTSATLHGHIDPDAAHGGGEVTSCRFEYGPTQAYGETAPCTPAPGYSAPADVSAKIEGLRPASTYHFRLAAANANGIPNTGEDEVFVTHGPPTVDHQAAEALTTSTRVRAEIDPWGYDTTCQLQYTTDTSFQASKWANATTVPCSPEDLGSGFGDVTVTFELRGLAREATYHYRFLASNQEGLSGYPGGTFETFAIQKFTLESFKNSHKGYDGGWLHGEPETQAGAHPYEVVSTVELSPTTVLTSYFLEGKTVLGEWLNATAPNIKDVDVDLPPGLIGNPTSGPKCNRYLVAAEACPPDTQVGVVEIFIDPPFREPGTKTGSVGERIGELGRNPEESGPYEPLYNIEPSGQYPAEFGAFIEGQVGVWIPFDVRTGSDYGVTAESLNISEVGGPVFRVRTRVWGVPADPAHDAERGCNGGDGCSSDQPLKPFLTNPTSCVGPQTETAMTNTWEEPEGYVKTTTEVSGFVGCGKLPFEPTFEAQPTSSVADSPTGLNVDLHVPQPEGCKEEAGKVECELAEADLKDATVTLPAGVTVDPSSADGLGTCSEAQVGYLPQKSAEVGHPQFTPGATECPDASKVGSVEVDSPLVDHPLSGAVYVAAQDANPSKSLLALYITVYDPQTGVVIKLPGKVTLDPVTGQLTTTFDENPQLPFNDFKLDFFGGSRAALTTPFTCGSYVASSVLTPWSAPEGKNAEPSSLPFGVTGPGDGACVDSEAQAPNGPGFTAGTASPVAGSYSPFVLKLTREDGSQRFGALNVTLPPGLVGKIAGIEQCSQGAIEQAQRRSHEGEGALEQSSPSCPSGSAVGVVHVGAGSGAPYYVTGHAYFAGPYKGAPFSLVIVTPAVAGPFDLGTVVVRAALYIDPTTAQVTVKSDPFPTILDGIPLDIRGINVDMNRNEFVLNPTSCNVMSVSGEEKSTAGSTALLSDRFQAGGCATLPFKPGFSVSTSAKATRADGTSVTFKISYPASALGKEAWLSAAKFEFPKELPARLSTIQKACPAGTFDANPASCGVGSKIGTAVVRTQLLPVPLEGPVYFVSNGNQKFPEAVIVLQGDGVTVDLHSETFINEKTGVTSATLPAIPGVPFEEATVTLPSGQYSEFTANTSLCTSKTVTVKKKVTVKSNGHKKTVSRKVKESVTSALALKMPTVFTGQNGAQITQSTPIGVSECSKVVKSKAKTVKKKHKKHKTGKSKRGK